MLTPAQLTYYRTFGYLKLPGFIAADVDWISEEFERAWAVPGLPVHQGTVRTTYPGTFIAARPRLSTLIAHPALGAALDDVLGSGWSCYGGDGNLYAGNTDWHSDCVYAPLGWQSKTTTPHLKVCVYLDRLTRATGALRVIPGSHHHGDVYARIVEQGIFTGSLGLAGSEVPCDAVETEPGDLILMDHRLKHASYGGGPRRRMFTLNSFAACPDARTSEAARQILRNYRDLNQVDWTTRPGWLDWIATLPADGQRNFANTVALGRQVMAERPAAAAQNATVASAV